MKNRGSGFEQQPGQVQQVYSDAGKTASGQRSVLAGYNPYSAIVEQEHYYTADQYQQYNFQCAAAKYFIMKCGNQRNIDESVQTGFWQTSNFWYLCTPPASCLTKSQNRKKINHLTGKFVKKRVTLLKKSHHVFNLLYHLTRNISLCLRNLKIGKFYQKYR